MKRKLYGKYNKRSKQIEVTFVDINDEQAAYNFQIANMKAEEQNPFYNSNDYNLVCLGVIQMEGEKNQIGIIYEYSKDFPVMYDNFDDFQKPKYNETYFKNMSKENEKEIKERSGII